MLNRVDWQLKTLQYYSTIAAVMDNTTVGFIAENDKLFQKAIQLDDREDKLFVIP